MAYDVTPWAEDETDFSPRNMQHIDDGVESLYKVIAATVEVLEQLEEYSK